MSRLKAIDGTPVTDGKSSILLTITDGDIAKSDPKHPETCAAARAICRDFGAVEARVHLSRIYIKRKKSSLWERYVTPPNLRTEIVSFDRGGGFDPGEYRLTPVQPSNRAGVRGRYGRSGLATLAQSKRPKPKKRLKPTNVTQNVRTGPA